MIKIVFYNVFILAFVSSLPILGQFDKYNQIVSEISSEVNYSRFNINNISTYIYNNGEADSDPSNNSGLMFPKGSNPYVVYKSGFVWGGIINNEIRVGGSTYNSGLLPGKILPDGTAENPNNNNVRVYRVRPDYKTSELFSEITSGEGTEEEIRLQYELDWNEWPAEDGAPFDDLDEDGIYNPQIDIPGVSGADQTLWFVANDLDSNQSKKLYGSLPMGLELQVTVWGYEDRNIFDNMIFKKYKLINKGKADIKDMYISIWSDPDIGDASNDFVGCDTLLNLVYAYNGTESDYFYENRPPSVGFTLLNGPEIKNNKNLEMTSFHFIAKHGDDNYSPPNLGEYNGTIQYYNFMQGKIGDGSAFPIPEVFGGGVTKFPFSGDPIKRSCFIEGIITVPQDRRMALGSGPFNMPVGDTQEILFSEIVAQGKDNLNSLQLLKYYVKQIPEDLKDINEIKKFQIPVVPIPEFSVDEFTNYKEIILSIENSDEIESYENKGYKFQGYNVYQFYDNNTNEAPLKIASYDIVDGVTKIYDQAIDFETGNIINDLVQDGSDSGISSLIKINYDYTTNTSLIKGKNYKYAVSSYYYNPNLDSSPHAIESFTKTHSVTFQENLRGISYMDTLKVDGSAKNVNVLVQVYNTLEVNDHKYQISFHTIDNKSIWELTDLTLNEVVLSDQEINDKASIIDGLKIYVSNSYRTLGNFESGGITVVKKDGKDVSLMEHFQVWEYPNGGNNEFSINSALTGDIDELYIDSKYLGSFDYELRFTENENFAVDYWDNKKVISVPFELWNIGINTPDDNSDDIRMIPFVKMQKDTNSWSINSTFEPTELFFEGNAHPASDWIYWMKPDVESGGYDNFASICKSSGIGSEYDTTLDNSTQGFYVDFQGEFNYAMGNMLVVDYDKDGNPPNAETTIRFSTVKPVPESETFTFTSKKFTVSFDLDNYSLFQNYPNPFNPATTIGFYLPKEGLVTLTIYNILGQKVDELLNNKINAGLHEISFYGKNLASGVYIYKLDTQQFSETKKMIFIK